MDVATVRAAIKAALSPLDLQVYDYAPDTPNVPAIVVYPRAFDYGASFDRNFDIQFTLLCVAGANNVEGAQRILDGWISDETSTSIAALIDADSTLGGVVSSAQIARMDQYRAINFADGVRYLSAELILDVFT